MSDRPGSLRAQFNSSMESAKRRRIKKQEEHESEEGDEYEEEDEDEYEDEDEEEEEEEYEDDDEEEDEDECEQEDEEEKEEDRDEDGSKTNSDSSDSETNSEKESAGKMYKAEFKELKRLSALFKAIKKEARMVKKKRASDAIKKRRGRRTSSGNEQEQNPERRGATERTSSPESEAKEESKRPDNLTIEVRKRNEKEEEEIAEVPSTPVRKCIKRSEGKKVGSKIIMETISTETNRASPGDRNVRERTEDMSEKKKNVKKRITLTKNNTTNAGTSATSNDSNKNVETETEKTQMDTAMAASERSRKEGTHKRTRDECVSKTQKPKEGNRGIETDKSPKKPENKRLYRIPKKSLEDQDIPLQLQTSKEDQDFFRERREDAHKKGGSRREEAPRRSETPSIVLQRGNIASAMQKIKEEVKRLHPLKIRKLGNRRSPCMYYNLSNCNHTNVIEHFVANGSQRPVTHMCAVCHWADNSCEMHRCMACPNLKIKHN